MSQSMLAMVLDIEVARHKRELRASFAAARARLIPPPRPLSERELMLAKLFDITMQQCGAWSGVAPLQAQGMNPYNSGGVQSGLGFWPFGGALGGVFGIPPPSHSSWGF